MNTFVPYTDNERSARFLIEVGGGRLNKQIAECGQMLRCLNKVARNEHHINQSGTVTDIPWSQHPAVLMWQGYEPALCRYMRDMARIRGGLHWEIIRCRRELNHWWKAEIETPWWWGGPIHRAHRRVLHAKRIGMKHPEYKQYYFWPVEK